MLIILKHVNDLNPFSLGLRNNVLELIRKLAFSKTTRTVSVSDNYIIKERNRNSTKCPKRKYSEIYTFTFWRFCISYVSEEFFLKFALMEIILCNRIFAIFSR